MARVQQGVTRDLRDEVYDHLLDLDMAFFGRTKMGQILSRLTYDVEQLRVLVAKELGKVVSQFFEFLAAALVMIVISWPSSRWWPSSWFPVTMGIWGPLIRKLKRNDRRVLDSAADVNTHIQETLDWNPPGEVLLHGGVRAGSFPRTHTSVLQAIPAV